MMNSKNSLWLSASFLMGTAAVTAQQVKKPHIILIMTDQQRGDCLGIQQSFIKTPNLDALAREGICFDKGYSTTPSSTPARAALLTGLSPWHHGMMGYGVVAERYRYEMPRLLRERGYYTFGIRCV